MCLKNSSVEKEVKVDDFGDYLLPSVSVEDPWKCYLRGCNEM